MKLNDYRPEELFEMLLDNPSEYLRLKLEKLDEHITNPEIKEDLTNHFTNLRQYIIDNEEIFILEELILLTPPENDPDPLIEFAE